MNQETTFTSRNRYKLTVEFDGTDFSGWQRQINATRTVQGVIEDALQQILQHKVAVIGSGRTDAGVHALAQVAHVDLALARINLEKLHDSVNSILPHDVRIISFAKTDPRFHARFQAISRTYLYRIERFDHPLKRRFCWTPPYKWDDGIIGAVAEFLAGRHSFRSFCLQRPGEDGYFCTIKSAVWQADGQGIDFQIVADRFLHKMVRGLVGALIDVGRGRYSVEDFRRLLDDPVKNGAVSVAPPQGLTLMKVEYPENV